MQEPSDTDPRPSAGGFSYGDPMAPIRYLSRTEVAEMIGVKPDTLGRYNLPAPDVIVGPVDGKGKPLKGSVRGWRERTIKDWHAARPSQR